MLSHIGASVLVGPAQLPWLHRLLLEAAATLGLAPPALYVRQSPVPNAYTLAVNGKRPAIVVHTALIELMSEAELQAVIAHELGHLACDHGVWLTLAAALAAPAGSLPGVPAFVAEGAAEALARWARAAELSCDRAAALVARDPSVVVSVLMKLAGGSPKLAGQLNVDAFLAQARSYDEASSSLLGWYISSAQARGATHPLPVARAAEVDRWARSEQYRRLLRALPLHSAWPRGAGGGGGGGGA
jgi:Zn-dependent protease with chaperone function